MQNFEDYAKNVNEGGVDPDQAYVQLKKELK